MYDGFVNEVTQFTNHNYMCNSCDFDERTNTTPNFLNTDSNFIDVLDIDEETELYFHSVQLQCTTRKHNHDT